MSKHKDKRRRVSRKIHPFLMQQVEATTLIIHLEELLAQTPHHIAWFLAHHIYSILFTDMRYHMKKFMTDCVNDATIGFTLSNGKHTPSFGKVGIGKPPIYTLLG